MDHHSQIFRTYNPHAYEFCIIIILRLILGIGSKWDRQFQTQIPRPIIRAPHITTTRAGLSSSNGLKTHHLTYRSTKQYQAHLFHLKLHDFLLRSPRNSKPFLKHFILSYIYRAWGLVFNPHPSYEPSISNISHLRPSCLWILCTIVILGLALDLGRNENVRSKTTKMNI